MKERSLVTCRGEVEEGDGDRNPACKYIGKKGSQKFTRMLDNNADNEA